jgi:hypothetical protein
MGVVIAIGLALLIAAGVLVSRSVRALVLAMALALSGAGIWLVWARHEYRGLDSCPWDMPGHGHPVLIGLALSVLLGVAMVLIRWKHDPRGWVAILGLSTTVIAGLVILVVAFFFGAGLRCTD